MILYIYIKMANSPLFCSTSQPVCINEKYKNSDRVKIKTGVNPFSQFPVGRQT